MLHTIKRPGTASGPHLLTLDLLGGSFPFTPGTEHRVDLDPEADHRLIVQLRRDGYEVEPATDSEPQAAHGEAEAEEES